VVIGYDKKRGDPPGKLRDPEAGACIDCRRCVYVCPTGIDIRNGLQLDCIGCAACVDACDEVMVRVQRPTGLIRYDSLNGLDGGVRRVLRPRLFLYLAFGVAGVLALAIGLDSHAPFEANVLRLPGPPYTVADGVVRNALQIHLVNKTSETVTFELTPASDGREYVLPMRRIRLESLGSIHVPLFVAMPVHRFVPGEALSVLVAAEGAEQASVRAPFLGPGSPR
jgi:polyferredoxin